MKIQHYCYTRNNHIDYGDFVLPDLPKNQVDFIRKHILPITGDSNPKFTIPKWILIKFDDVIVWGCCCWNSLLAENHFKDSLGRPVYGFFSIVITNFIPDEVKLPSDIDYFKELYSIEIEPYWNSSERRYSATDASISDRYKYIRAGRKVNLTLNTDLFQCLSLGNLDKDMVVSDALTIDNVSLLIDNDNIQQATNKKGAFMNCLSSAVAPGSYTVKQLCPQCKEYVSAFTSAGICSTCKEKDQARIVSIKKEEEDMDKQMKYELEVAQNKIAELKSEVESNRQRLKKKDRLIKILVALLLVLLVTLLYSQDSFSLKLFDKKQETQYTPGIDSRNWDNGRTNNDYMHNQGASFEFLESAINVDANAYNKFPIKVQSNVDTYRAESNVDWIKILTSENGLITIEITANIQKDSRKGNVAVMYGNSNTKSIGITQNGKQN